ncbi:hypothetical protein BLNAU_5794 [Blattamonas nauphoetae]|uniref:Uncharacterized protein n=1 Tax=Blattamonas nauphoetae TaxID=2049346 RepID=A0ABQ9Y684_9EUKA|nr:hypothetical protein BLNAU_5794 [Blattamonas nauphoetae]
MEKAFTYKPEIVHTFQQQPRLADPKIAQLYSLCLFIPLLIVLVLNCRVGHKKMLPQSAKEFLYFFIFYGSIVATFAVFLGYWLDYYKLIPEIALSLCGVFVAAISGKLYFEERRNHVFELE